MFKITGSLFFIAMLTGCASAEFNSAKNQCSPEAYRLYPVSIQQKVENRTRYEMRGTGQFTCSSTGVTNYMGGSAFNNSTTNCVEQKVGVAVPYQEVVSVDVNAPYRNSFVSECAMRICLQQNGTGDKCKSGL